MSSSQKPQALFEKLGGKFPRRATEADREILIPDLTEKLADIRHKSAACAPFNLIGRVACGFAGFIIETNLEALKARRPVMLHHGRGDTIRIETNLDRETPPFIC